MNRKHYKLSLIAGVGVFSIIGSLIASTKPLSKTILNSIADKENGTVSFKIDNNHNLINLDENKYCIVGSTSLGTSIFMVISQEKEPINPNIAYFPSNEESNLANTSINFYKDASCKELFRFQQINSLTIKSNASSDNNFLVDIFTSRTKDGSSFIKIEDDYIIDSNDRTYYFDKKPNYLEITSDQRSNVGILVSEISLNYTCDTSGEVYDEYSVLFVKENGYSLSNISGINLDQNNVGYVDQESEISFKININNGYYKGINYKVILNETTLSPNENNIYKATISSNSIIYVLGVEQGNQKYRITTNTPDGVHLLTSYSKNVDGSYIVNGSTFDFALEFDQGYTKDDNFVVLANGSSIVGSQNSYSLTLTGDVYIEIKGVSFKSVNVTFAKSDLYSFYDISGVSINNSIGKVIKGSNISFKVVSTKLAKLTSSNLIVKNNNEIINCVNNVYNINCNQDVNITVEGLEYNEDIIKINEFSFKDIVGNSVTTVEIRENNDKAPLELGYQNSSYIFAMYNSKQQIGLNSDEPFEKFSEIKFAVKCVNNNWFEPTDKEYDWRSTNWTEFSIKKDSNDGYYYLSIGDSKKTDTHFTKDNKLQDFKVRIQGLYYVTELIATKNPDYVDPYYDLSISPIQGGIKGDNGLYSLLTKYNTKYNFASLNPNLYSEIKFKIITGSIDDGKGYYGIMTTASKTLNTNSEYNIVFTKVSDNTFNIKADSYNWGDFDLKGDFANAYLYAHSAKANPVNLELSEITVRNDENIVLPSYEVSINNLAEHISYSVTGQTTNTFDVVAGSSIILTLNYDEEAYVATVLVNGTEVTTSNKIYNILISEDCEIEINESKNLIHTLDVAPIQGATLNENGEYTMSLVANKKYPLADINPTLYKKMSFSMTPVIISGTDKYYSFEDADVRKTFTSNQLYVVEIFNKLDGTFKLVVTPPGLAASKIYTLDNLSIGSSLSNLRLNINGSYNLTISKMTVEELVQNKLSYSKIAPAIISDTSLWSEATADYEIDCTDKSAISLTTNASVYNFTGVDVDVTQYKELIFFGKDVGSYKSFYFKIINNNNNTSPGSKTISGNNWHSFVFKNLGGNYWNLTVDNDENMSWDLGQFTNLNQLSINNFYDHRTYVMSCLYGGK